jgi:hypothetical protein
MVQKSIAILFGTSSATGKAERNQSFQSDFHISDQDTDFSKANEKSDFTVSDQYPSSRQKSLEWYPHSQTNCNCANALKITRKRELEFIVSGKNTKELFLVLPAFLFGV